MDICELAAAEFADIPQNYLPKIQQPRYQFVMAY